MTKRHATTRTDRLRRIQANNQPRPGPPPALTLAHLLGAVCILALTIAAIAAGIATLAATLYTIAPN
jgi:hypothetical protein